MSSSPKSSNNTSKSKKSLTRGEKVVAFIETYCYVPEGDLLGQKIKLEPFQRRFILAVYDNKVPTKKAYLSIARKNAKTATIACILLAHLAGPEAVQNSRIVSGAMSREQAAEVFNYASKMVMGSPELASRVKIVPSKKMLVGLNKNVEYLAISAEGRTAHGKSPIIAILDEVGQVRGPKSDFIDAIITSQGAYSKAIVFAISTQAATDGDLFSIWLDDAITNKPADTVCHLYTADDGCDVMDESQWAKANPALGKFRSIADIRARAEVAARMPSFEPTFRNLYLNQRVETFSPFISKAVWVSCKGDVAEEAFENGDVYAGLDLSTRNDLTSFVAVANYNGKHYVKALFWMPDSAVMDKVKNDKAPYDVWIKQGFLNAVPDKFIRYDYVANDICDFVSNMNLVSICFDRYRIESFNHELNVIGVDLPMVEHGQGFKDMSVSIDATEQAIYNNALVHDGNPVLTMCMANARIISDPAGSKKLDKQKSTGRIDGAVALVMAFGAMSKGSTKKTIEPSIFFI